MSLKDSRIDYNKGTLEDDLKGAEPLILFNEWLSLAKENVALDYNAMTLTTIGNNDFPEARVVLLREILDEELVFYTNYTSAKAQEISRHNRVGVNFFWRELEKQVRISGIVERVSAEISDAYFQSRPRKSQLGAWVSNQSEEISNREVLTSKVDEITEKFKGLEVPRPEFWGGFRIKPVSFEFWQGRSGRLHDRLLFQRPEGQVEWTCKRLSP